MTAAGTLRRTVNRFLRPFDVEIERVSRIELLKDRYVLHPTLIEIAVANSPAPVVVDVGASMGSKVAEVLRLRPRAEVFAFEPYPPAFDRLQARFSGDPRVHLLQAAVGEDRGRLPFHVGTFAPASSLLPLRTGQEARMPAGVAQTTIEVDVVSLDDWLTELEDPPERIDLIKIDTQGYESRIVHGGKRAFGSARFAILEAGFVPCWDGEAPYEELVTLMRDAAFVVRSVGAGHYDRPTGELQYVDILFERTDA